eukprot:3284124-Rhodomonas_salina.1
MNDKTATRQIRRHTLAVLGSMKKREGEIAYSGWNKGTGINRTVCNTISAEQQQTARMPKLLPN